MMARKLEVPPSTKGKATADDWTNATATTPAAKEEATQKLSLELPLSVHRMTKAGAALRGNSMLGEITEMCRARNGMAPWPADVVESVLKQIAAEQQGEPEPESEAPATPARPRTRTAARKQSA
ncbi:hypothetical protein AB0J47_41925 [Nocardia sp. NPDC049737]|uniref:hypothetical protein n=1 Tax=Nocardia sp. NPDC049737 TaxID=3154358 RepID=UPI003436FAC6